MMKLLPCIGITVAVFVVVVTTMILNLYRRRCTKKKENKTSTESKSQSLPAALSPIERLDKIYNGEVINTLHVYFELKIIENSTWMIFIDERLHELFHSFKQGICCKNNVPSACGSIKKVESLSKDQFFLLYQKDLSIPAVHQLKDVRGRITQHCLCSFSPNIENGVSNLDITLMCILMKTCHRTPAGHPDWFKDVKHVRNVIIAHRGDECTITAETVRENKEKLENAIINIASTIGQAFQRGVKRRISEENSKYLQIDDIKDTIFLCHAELEQKIMNALNGQQNDVKIDNQTFHFLRATVNPDIDNVQTRKGKKTCTIKWTFTDPGNWDIKAMKKRLKNIRKLGDFKVNFVYEGSVIIHTTSDIAHFTKECVIRDVIEEFLLLLVRVLRLSATEEHRISYSLQILSHTHENTEGYADIPPPVSLVKEGAKLQSLSKIAIKITKWSDP